VGVRVALLIASVGLAILSWKYVETPFRKRQWFPRRRQIFGFAGLTTATLLGVGLLGYYSDGFPARFPAQALKYANSRFHGTILTGISLKQAQTGQFVELGAHSTNQPVSVLLWGDSHAMAIIPVIDELCRRHAQPGFQATQSATAPVLGYVSTKYGLKEETPAFANAVLAFIAERRIKNVILAAFWTTYPITDSFRSNLFLTIQAIQAAGAKVYVLEDVPFPDFDVPRIAALTVLHHQDPEKLGLALEPYAQSHHELRQLFAQVAPMGVTVLDPTPYFLNRAGLYDVVRNDQVLFCDSHHLTTEGARLLAPLFEPIFQTN